MIKKYSFCIDSLETWYCSLLRPTVLGEAAPGTLKQTPYKVRRVPPTLSRRMSSLTKISVDLALLATENVTPDHVVSASQHGEVATSLELLKMIGQQEVLSPLLFSQSVHNTTVGTYALIKGCRVPTTSLSSHQNSFWMGLISSLMRFSEAPNTKVLYIYADEAVPPEILDPLSSPPSRPFYLAAVLSKPAPENETFFQLELNTDESQEFFKFSLGEADPHPGIEFLEWIRGDSPMEFYFHCGFLKGRLKK